jgi:hypothetical protein
VLSAQSRGGNLTEPASLILTRNLKALQLATTLLSSFWKAKSFTMSFIVSLFKPLAYLSLPVLFLRSISNTSPVARYYVKAFAYAGTLATVASGCFFAAIGFSLTGKKYDLNNFVARVFYTAANNFFNLEVEVEGEEYLDQRPAVLMCNHQSMVDIVIVGRSVSSFHPHIGI